MKFFTNQSFWQYAQLIRLILFCIAGGLSWFVFERTLLVSTQYQIVLWWPVLCGGILLFEMGLRHKNRKNYK